MSSDLRPKATHIGKLFDAIDCAVLDNGKRVATGTGLVELLGGKKTSKNVPAKNAGLDRFLDRLPSKYEHLASLPRVEFVLPHGGVAQGIDGDTIIDICQAYVEALADGLLHPKQVPLAGQAARILTAAAKVGMRALIDEATGYQDIRRAGELSYAFRALLLEKAEDWDLMWPTQFVQAVCKLHGHEYAGGVHPQWMASTYSRIYEMILGAEVVAELKRRNPEPMFGSNHHSWLTPEARNVVAGKVPICTLLAEQSASKGEFWARMDAHFSGAGLQLVLFAPKRRKASSNGNDGEGGSHAAE